MQKNKFGLDVSTVREVADLNLAILGIDLAGCARLPREIASSESATSRIDFVLENGRNREVARYLWS